MSLIGKKIWIDIEEPKTAVMFKSLIEKLKKEGCNLLVTARNFDSTLQILKDSNIDFIFVGHHGETLKQKLNCYINRLEHLFRAVKDFNPDYFVTFSSIEGIRIAYGLQIPSIGFNDEPRNTHICKLIFPYLNKIITPSCVPEQLYIDLHANPNKLISYNGIDEIAWISEYTPNPKVLEKYNLKKGQYVIIRSEPSSASYFINKFNPEESIIKDFFPSIYSKFPKLKYFILVRSEKQEKFLREKLKKYYYNPNIIITQYLSNILDLCFYSALVISGGGTIVRESSLLNVPSIEFFSGDTAPQEQFLIKNGFPLFHIKEPEKISEKAIKELSKTNREFIFSSDKIKKFENPITICFNLIQKDL